jgi:hypothetical protein
MTYLHEWLSLERAGKRADLPSVSWKELVQNIPTLSNAIFRKRPFKETVSKDGFVLVVSSGVSVKFAQS